MIAVPFVNENVACSAKCQPPTVRRNARYLISVGLGQKRLNFASIVQPLNRPELASGWPATPVYQRAVQRREIELRETEVSRRGDLFQDGHRCTVDLQCLGIKRDGKKRAAIYIKKMTGVFGGSEI